MLYKRKLVHSFLSFAFVVVVVVVALLLIVGLRTRGKITRGYPLFISKKHVNHLQSLNLIKFAISNMS